MSYTMHDDSLTSVTRRIKSPYATKIKMLNYLANYLSPDVAYYLSVMFSHNEIVMRIMAIMSVLLWTLA